MGLRDTARCSRCQKDVPFSHVRYLPDGKRIACATCLGIIVREKEIARASEGAIADFQCVRCRHQFRRQIAVMPKACPQCAGRQLIRFDRKSITGSQLLRADPLLDKDD